MGERRNSPALSCGGGGEEDEAEINPPELSLCHFAFCKDTYCVIYYQPKVGKISLKTEQNSGIVPLMRPQWSKLLKASLQRHRKYEPPETKATSILLFLIVVFLNHHAHMHTHTWARTRRPLRLLFPCPPNRMQDYSYWLIISFFFCRYAQPQFPKCVIFRMTAATTITNETFLRFCFHAVYHFDSVLIWWGRHNILQKTLGCHLLARVSKPISCSRPNSTHGNCWESEMISLVMSLTRWWPEISILLSHRNAFTPNDRRENM